MCAADMPDARLHAAPAAIIVAAAAAIFAAWLSRRAPRDAAEQPAFSLLWELWGRWGTDQTPGDRTTSLPDMPRVLVFGDSLTERGYEDGGCVACGILIMAMSCRSHMLPPYARVRCGSPRAMYFESKKIPLQY